MRQCNVICKWDCGFNQMQSLPSPISSSLLRVVHTHCVVYDVVVTSRRQPRNRENHGSYEQGCERTNQTGSCTKMNDTMINVFSNGWFDNFLKFFQDFPISHQARVFPLVDILVLVFSCCRCENVRRQRRLGCSNNRGRCACQVSRSFFLYTSPNRRGRVRSPTSPLKLVQRADIHIHTRSAVSSQRICLRYQVAHALSRNSPLQLRSVLSRYQSSPVS